MTREIAGVVVELQTHKGTVRFCYGSEIWSGGRAVEGGGLENRCAERYRGSNPSRSVKLAVRVFMVAH